MIRKYPVIISVVAIFSAVTAFSKPRASDNITVNQTADKITITGGNGEGIASDRFSLSKDGWYIIKISYTGTEIGVCQLSLVTQTMITAKETIGEMLTDWMGPNTTEIIRNKGSVKSEDYMIYVENAGGPWTVEILKSPKPTPVSGDTTFSGTTDKVTPFFHLKAGSAKFTMHQKRKNQFTKLTVNLTNADTGALVDHLCNNVGEPTLTAKVEIRESGNYVLEVIGGGTWDVSYTQ